MLASILFLGVSMLGSGMVLYYMFAIFGGPLLTGTFINAASINSTTILVSMITTPTATATPYQPLPPTTVFTPLPTYTPSPSPTFTPIPLQPEDWMMWDVAPDVSGRAKEIYLNGIAMGNDPRSFSIIGDCQSEPHAFLGPYDAPDRYSLAEDSLYLQETIDNFNGSFSRQSLTTIDGSNAATMLAKGWYRRDVCAGDESPLQCELRLHKPSIVFIHVGTHWSARNSQYLQEIVEQLIAAGSLPIIATKADNREGNNSINESLARVAYMYDLPLWNFWASVQDLSYHGLDPYREGGYMYINREGQDIHRLTALMALDTVWRAANK